MRSAATTRPAGTGRFTRLVLLAATLALGPARVEAWYLPPHPHPDAPARAPVLIVAHGNGELIEPDVTGTLCEAPAPDALTAAILQKIAHAHA